MADIIIAGVVLVLCIAAIATRKRHGCCGCGKCGKCGKENFSEKK